MKPPASNTQHRVAGSRAELSIASSSAVTAGSATRTSTSTRRSRLRCIMSALPIHTSPPPRK